MEPSLGSGAAGHKGEFWAYTKVHLPPTSCSFLAQQLALALKCSFQAFYTLHPGQYMSPHSCLSSSHTSSFQAPLSCTPPAGLPLSSSGPCWVSPLQFLGSSLAHGPCGWVADTISVFPVLSRTSVVLRLASPSS